MVWVKSRFFLFHLDCGTYFRYLSSSQPFIIVFMWVFFFSTKMLWFNAICSDVSKLLWRSNWFFKLSKSIRFDCFFFFFFIRSDNYQIYCCLTMSIDLVWDLMFIIGVIEHVSFERGFWLWCFPMCCFFLFVFIFIVPKKKRKKDRQIG